MSNKNWNCDGSHCTCSDSEIRVLPTGPIDAVSGDGCSNALLCRACFYHELLYRKDRNLELNDANAFKLPTWDSLRVYKA